MRIEQLIEQHKPVFSFEFFPPKTEQGVEKLYATVADLRQLNPAFVSVTYGAGGSTRERTIEIVKRIKRELGIEAMAHFTCVGATVDELVSVLEEMAGAGIENVLALRGDPPQGQERFERTEGGLGYSDELTALIAERFDFSIGGACYPETHVEAESAEADLENLKRKVEAGARFLITQLFFHNDSYFEFVDRARAAGIDVPIIPGIMPIASYEQITRITKMCGAAIPENLQQALDALKDDADAITELGVAYASLQAAELLQHGAPGIHFYTLNKSPATRAILSALYATRPWERSGDQPVLATAG